MKILMFVKDRNSKEEIYYNILNRAVWSSDLAKLHAKWAHQDLFAGDENKFNHHMDRHDLWSDRAYAFRSKLEKYL